METTAKDRVARERMNLQEYGDEMSNFQVLARHELKTLKPLWSLEVALIILLAHWQICVDHKNKLNNNNKLNK